MLVAPLRQSLLRSVALLFATAFLCKTSPAALLVYEGFNGYGTTGTAFGVPQPNANTVGLRSSLAYRATGWALGNGLTFGSLRTSGNAINYTSANQSYLSAQLDLDGNSANAASFTGTLYSSYLVNISSRISNGGVQLRVADVPDNVTGTRFFSDADTRLDSTDNPGIAYGGSVSTSSTPLALNTTYLMISRYTNVGTALSGGNPGVATMFILTEAQFANLILQSNWESYLDNPSTTVGSGSNQIYGRATNSATTGTYTFNDASYVHFLAVSNGSFDEFRYGDSLASVLPIPEPGRAALILLGGMGILLRRRRAS